MKRLRKVEWKMHVDRRRISLLEDNNTGRFEDKVIELVNIGFPNLFGCFMVDISRHMMSCVGGGVGERMEVHGGGVKR